MYFRSSYSTLFVVLMFGVGIYLLYLGFSIENLYLKVILILLGIVTLIFPYSIFYKLEKEELVIYFFFPLYRVNLKEILSIQPMKSFEASPASGPLSDRKMIKWGDNKYVIISPKDWTKFLSLLLDKNPNIKVS